MWITQDFPTQGAFQPSGKQGVEYGASTPAQGEFRGILAYFRPHTWAGKEVCDGGING